MSEWVSRWLGRSAVRYWQRALSTAVCQYNYCRYIYILEDSKEEKEFISLNKEHIRFVEITGPRREPITPCSQADSCRPRVSGRTSQAERLGQRERERAGTQAISHLALSTSLWLDLCHLSSSSSSFTIVFFSNTMQLVGILWWHLCPNNHHHHHHDDDHEADSDCWVSKFNRRHTLDRTQTGRNLSLRKSYHLSPASQPSSQSASHAALCRPVCLSVCLFVLTHTTHLHVSRWASKQAPNWPHKQTIKRSVLEAISLRVGEPNIR